MRTIVMRQISAKMNVSAKKNDQKETLCSKCKNDCGIGKPIISTMANEVFYVFCEKCGGDYIKFDASHHSKILREFMKI